MEGGQEEGGEGVLVNMLFVSAPITVSLKQGDSGRVEKEAKEDSWEEEKEKAANYAKLHFSKMFQSRPRQLPFTSPAVDGRLRVQQWEHDEVVAGRQGRVCSWGNGV